MKVPVKVELSVPRQIGDVIYTPFGQITVTAEWLAQQGGSSMANKELTSQHVLDVPDGATGDTLQALANAIAGNADTVLSGSAPSLTDDYLAQNVNLKTLSAALNKRILAGGN